MKRIITLFLLLSVSLFAQNYTVISSSYFPRDFYVGDEVELRLELLLEDNVKVELPESLPEIHWLDFVSIKTFEYEDTVELRITLIPYSPGTRTLPPLTLGDIVLTDIKIHINSLVQYASQEVKPIKPPFFLPGTNLILVSSFIIILGGPFAFFFISRFFRKRFEYLVEKHKYRKPLKAIQNTLKILKAESVRMSGRDFFYDLTLALRNYLSSRTNLDFHSITAKEFHHQLKLANFSTEMVENVASLVVNADEVKFGGQKASEEQKTVAISIIESMIKYIEELTDKESKKEVDHVDS